MTNEINAKDRQRKQLAAWRERALIANRDGHEAVAEVAAFLAAKYSEFLESEVPQTEPSMFTSANLLRRKIEASEQHRTMSVEHGLGDEAIDVTLEIQEMERELIALVQEWQKREN